ncbi:MAG: HtaA domain-containing protein [Microbacterium sp.]
MSGDRAPDLVVEWGLKRSLVDYLTATEDFAVSVAGGATFDAEAGLAIPAVRDGEGLIRFAGSVTLTAHGGALTVPIVDGAITASALTIADPEEPTERLALVTLEPASADPPARRWTARLAEEADPLFLYTYVPRVAFEDVVVRRLSA